jgi:hypothetical protein
MISWILNNLIGITGIMVGGFIAYHVYFLSRRLDLKDKLSHKDVIRRTVEPILHKINGGISSKCELVNVKKYLTHYPHSNDENRHGYTYFGGELKALRFDGIEFFCGVKELYKTKNGNFTLEKDANEKQDSNVFEVGIIPYEWIEHIDPRGDEFSYRPQFFAQFKGLHKTPYRYLTYYIKSNTYHEGSDPMDMRWQSIEVGKD